MVAAGAFKINQKIRFILMAVGPLEDKSISVHNHTGWATQYQVLLIRWFASASNAELAGPDPLRLPIQAFS
jgi:hypothetical protein